MTRSRAERGGMLCAPNLTADLTSHAAADVLNVCSACVRSSGLSEQLWCF